MALRVLFDTNVILDVLLRREPWRSDSRTAWNAHVDGLAEAYVAAISFTNLFFVLRRLTGTENARLAVRACLSTFPVVAVDREVLLIADALHGVDFEDNVQIACARILHLDAIVTRDAAGFEGTSITVLMPAELLEQLPRRNQE